MEGKSYPAIKAILDIGLSSSFIFQRKIQRNPEIKSWKQENNFGKNILLKT
jgi:hypothetical protein